MANLNSKDLKDIRGLERITLNISQNTSLKDGKETKNYGKLRISYVAEKDSVKDYRKVVEIVTRDITSLTIMNDSSIDDPNIERENQVGFLTQLTAKYNLDPPYIVKEHGISPLKGDWEIRKPI